jgi:hypothetical protein
VFVLTLVMDIAPDLSTALQAMGVFICMFGLLAGQFLPKFRVVVFGEPQETKATTGMSVGSTKNTYSKAKSSAASSNRKPSSSVAQSSVGPSFPTVPGVPSVHK